MTEPALRIALDIGPLYGHRTGVGVAVDGLVSALTARDDVELLPYLVSGRAQTRDGHLKLPIPGIVASHVWSRSERPHADRWLGDAQVVHGTNYVAPPSRVPTVVSVYDCWFLAHTDLANPLVRRAGKTLQRAAARGAWIHTSSDATAELARDLLDTDRVVTVYLGAPASPPPLADLARPEAATAIAGRPFILAIGTEERRKDLRLLISAFDALAKDSADIQLVLAGAAGDETEAVTASITALPETTRDRVHRLGPVDDDAKHWLLRQASVLAYPSLDEGFGFPILEAQAVGTPVVASKVGAIPEIGGDGAATVAGRDPAAFCEVLARVLTSGTSRLGLIEAGHRNVTRFSWDATASAMIDLYRRAVEN